MKNDESASAFRERIERGALRRTAGPAIALVDDHDVGLGELVSRRKTQCVLNRGAALCEELGPLRQKRRVVVLAVACGTVSLLASSNEDSKRVALGTDGRP